MAHGHHIIPSRTLINVFLGLIFLTVLTYVTAEYVHLGALEVPVALAIAAVKAGLVVSYFMALKYDNKVNLLIFMVGALFVIVFTLFTWFDTGFRGQLGNMGSTPIETQEITPYEGDAGDHGGDHDSGH